MTLYLHEFHSVIGTREDEFEAAFRDAGGWMDVLGRGDDARLLYYAHQAHGTGMAYRVVTITAIADGAAWERLARSVDGGALASIVGRIDSLRHGVTAKMLLPVKWSPLNEVDLGSVASTPADHEPTLFMEDTGWPSSSLPEYIDFWGDDYHPMLLQHPESMRLLEIQACWTAAYGAGRRPEGILWQRIHNLEILMALFTREVAPEHKAPGSYMERALKFRDQWESRLLRTAPWSPRW
ncbi:MAG: hypothetical protein ACYDH6_04725 [Acidimicrobiales bacterium]